MDIAKIGRYIAEKRKRARLTQRQLADKLGKSDKSVSKWERGICLPDVSVYMELCEILEISVNEFLAGEDISEDSVREKSDETLLQVSKEGKNKQKFLRRIIVALCIILTGFITVIAVIACKKMRQPRNFIEEVSPDSAEMKTAELMSGADGVMMFRYMWNALPTLPTAARRWCVSRPRDTRPADSARLLLGTTFPVSWPGWSRNSWPRWKRCAAR